MKKLLILVLIILICALVLVTGIKGIHLGNINVLGISEIKSENADLEKKLEQATTLVSTDYPSQISTINSDIKAMNNEKQTYEDLVAVSTDSEVAASLQKQKYTVDKLWAKIGTLATDEGLDAKFELRNGSLTPASSETFKYYDIDFTVEGSYAGISLYISDLEDDSELNFKIENFKMEPVADGSIVKATFTTNDIAIEGISTSSATTPTTTEKTPTETNTQNSNSTNTTNTTNTDTNTASANTTNTTNSVNANTTNTTTNSTSGQ